MRERQLACRRGRNPGAEPRVVIVPGAAGLFGCRILPVAGAAVQCVLGAGEFTAEVGGVVKAGDKADGEHAGVPVGGAGGFDDGGEQAVASWPQTMTNRGRGLVIVLATSRSMPRFSVVSVPAHLAACAASTSGAAGSAGAGEPVMMVTGTGLIHVMHAGRPGGRHGPEVPGCGAGRPVLPCSAAGSRPAPARRQDSGPGHW